MNAVDQEDPTPRPDEGQVESTEQGTARIATPATTASEERRTEGPDRGRGLEDAVELLRTSGRIALGGAVMGAESLIERLRSWERSPAPPPDSPETERAVEAARSLSDAVVGLGVRTAALAERFVDMAADAGGLGARLGNRLLGAVRSATPSVITDPVDAVLGSAGRGRDRLAGVGREEVLRARALFQTVASDVWDRSVSRLAHDRELGRLVRTQSQGIASGLVEDVRGGATRADEGLERAVSRILGRGRREPRVANGGTDGEDADRR